MLGAIYGETANDIARRKKPRYSEDILDNMGSDELIANFIQNFSNRKKFKNENIKIAKEANGVKIKYAL